MTVWLRRMPKIAAVVALVGGLILAACVSWVRLSARSHIYSAADVPPAPVAIVFGALVNPSGTPSDFLVARLALGQRLYDSGKVRALLVSGDNSTAHYDEPDVMRHWLIDHGVPPAKVVADYAGFDTYDTCVRAHRIFGVQRAILVSQAFHVPRAVTICRREGVLADGVGDTSVSDQFAWWRGTAREQAADIKAAYDVLSGRSPVFLGRRETSLDAALAAG
jgi:vancomycin permeability regulator SanA